MCGGNTQKAPTAYMPTGQSGADNFAQTGIQNLTNTGMGLQSSVDPSLAAISQHVIDNPYFNPAMAGMQNASNMASGSVAPQMFQGASQLQGLGNTAAGAAAPTMQTAVDYGKGMSALASGYGQGASPLATSYGTGTAGQAAGYGQGTSPLAALAGMSGSQALNGLVPATTTPELMAGLQVLQTGFDPQRDLYNQQYQQNLDQQNAINAMNGVAGSPYAAGVTGQSVQNFNTNWENQQLGRQLQALGGYDSAASTAAGNAANLVGTGSNVLNSGLTTGQNLLNSGLTTGQNLLNSGLTTGQNLLNNGLTTGQSLLDNGISTGVGAFHTLSGDANTSALNAANLGTQGLNTMAQGAQLPYDLFLQQQQAGLNALGSRIQGTNSAGGLTQAGVGDSLNYLSAGQNATSLNQNATQINNQAAQAQAAGFGQLFGDVAGIALAPFTGGASLLPMLGQAAGGAGGGGGSAAEMVGLY